MEQSGTRGRWTVDATTGAIVQTRSAEEQRAERDRDIERTNDGLAALSRAERVRRGQSVVKA